MEQEIGMDVPQTTHHGVEFNGNGNEYFKIWIVNICLSILTLGIYSAWAKVRTQQYFYGNTHIDNASFQYLATPIQILKGRIIAFIAMAIYIGASEANPIIGSVLLMLILLLSPYIMVKSLAFNARHSAYRNLRFNFEEDIKGAYLLFAMPILIAVVFIASSILFADNEAVAYVPSIVLIAGLLYMPHFEYKMYQFTVNNGAFGGSHFRSRYNKNPYYPMYLKLFALSLLVGGIGITVAIILTRFFKTPNIISPEQIFYTPQFIVSMIIYFLVYTILIGYTKAMRMNIFYNGLRLLKHKTDSQVNGMTMSKILFSNTLLTILTLGMYYPWAKIRLAQYRAETLQVISNSPLDEFVQLESQKVSATGSEVGEFFDIGFSIGG